MSLTDSHHGAEIFEKEKPKVFKIKKIQKNSKRRFFKKLKTNREWSRDEIVSAFIIAVIDPSHEDVKFLEKRLNFHRTRSETQKALPNLEELADVFLIEHKEIAKKIKLINEGKEPLTALELDYIKNKMFQYLLSCNILESLSEQRNFGNLSKLQFNLKYKISENVPTFDNILGHKNISVQLLVKDYMILKEVCDVTNRECSLLDGASACQFLLKKLNRSEDYDLDQTETEH